MGRWGICGGPCGQEKEIKAHGLCAACYMAERRRSVPTSPGESPQRSSDWPVTSSRIDPQQDVLATLDSEPPEWNKWDDSRLIQQVKQLSKDTLETAIERGKLLKRLRLSKEDYEIRNIGLCAREGFRLINLATSPRTYLPWDRPYNWRADLELVKYDAREGRYGEIVEHRYAVPERIFEALTEPREDGFSLVNYNSTPRQVLDAIKASKWRLHAESKNKHQFIVPATLWRPQVRYENQIVCGNSLHLIRMMDDQSIDAVITSPPYALQRQGHYQGAHESVYIDHARRFFSLLSRKLKKRGSIIIVIRPHVRNGRISTYVDDATAALRELGWFEFDRIIWIKPDAPPYGSVDRLRQGWEYVLCFAQAEPYIDTKTGGRPSDKLGMLSDNPYGVIHGTSPSFENGIARKLNFIIAPVGDNDRGVAHPAKFPPTLVAPLIETFCPPGGLVFDPFAGSGTTCLVARQLSRSYIGFDSKQKYVDLMNHRLKYDRRYQS